MKLSKLEKIDIIKTVIEIWGSITDTLFRNHVPIKLKERGNDKYSITQYIEKYDIDKREEKFPKEKLIDLAKRFATEQEKYLEKGDYN